MTDNAFFPRQGMPHSAVAPYIEVSPRPARWSPSVPDDLDRKAQLAHLPPPHPDIAGLTATPITKDVPIGDIHMRLMVRDRLERTDDSVRHLARSIRKNGLMRPIVLQDTPNGLELVEGTRRLAAVQLLAHQIDRNAFATIKATILPIGTAIPELYHRMIAENLRSESLSLAEMATVAMSYAADPATDETTVADAIAVLYARQAPDRIAAINTYAQVLSFIGTDLLYPNCLSLALVRALAGCIQSQPGAIRAIRQKLRAGSANMPSEESVLLWRCVASVGR